MYCTNCGKEISSKGKFCMFCGTQYDTVSELLDKHAGIVPLSSQENTITSINNTCVDKLKEKIEVNIGEYLYSMKVKTTMTVKQYFHNFNLLKKPRIICWAMMPTIGILFGPVGILLGVFVGIFSYLYYMGYKLIKENNRVRKYKHYEGIIEDIFHFIQEHSVQYEEIECRQFYDDYIEIGFKGQTIHKIFFDDDRNTYKIKCKKCQFKTVLKNGGKSSSAIMYKNAMLLNPIISAMVECAVDK